MKALIRTKGGKEFSSMNMQDLETTAPSAREIKVKMVASRINPVDMDLMKGFPSLKYKTPQIGGVDGGGKVVEVGSEVTDFKFGDEVFFYRAFNDIGTWAEEIVLPAAIAAKTPRNLSLKNSGGIALPLITAFEALESLNANSGESILIHGAGGGVGFQAVLLAKAKGLKIIANASSRDENNLKQAGVERLIDYKKANFTEVLKNEAPDYVFDVLGKETLLKSIQLQPKKVVSTSFPDVTQMHKTGVKLPGFLNFIQKLINKKIQKDAKKNKI